MLQEAPSISKPLAMDVVVVEVVGAAVAEAAMVAVGAAFVVPRLVAIGIVILVFCEMVGTPLVC
jgi:hypothetical protein